MNLFMFQDCWGPRTQPCDQTVGWLKHVTISLSLSVSCQRLPELLSAFVISSEPHVWYSCWQPASCDALMCCACMHMQQLKHIHVLSRITTCLLTCLQQTWHAKCCWSFTASCCCRIPCRMSSWRVCPLGLGRFNDDKHLLWQRNYKICSLGTSCNV